MNSFFTRGMVAVGFATLLFPATSAFAGGGETGGRAKMFASLQGASCQMLFVGEPQWATDKTAQLTNDIKYVETQLALPNSQRDAKDPRVLAGLRRSKNNPVTETLNSSLSNKKAELQSVRKQIDHFARLGIILQQAEHLPSFGKETDGWIQDWAVRSIEPLAYALYHHEARPWVLAGIEQSLVNLQTVLQAIASRHDGPNAELAVLRRILNYQLDHKRPEEGTRATISAYLMHERMAQGEVRAETLNTLTATTLELVPSHARHTVEMFQAIASRLSRLDSPDEFVFKLPDNEIADLTRVAIRYNITPDAVVTAYRALADNSLSLPLHPRTRQTKRFSPKALATLLDLVFISQNENSVKSVITQFRKLRAANFARAETGEKILSDEATAILTAAMFRHGSLYDDSALTPESTLGLYDYHLSVTERGTPDVTIAYRAVLGRKYDRKPEEIQRLEKHFLMLTEHTQTPLNIPSLMRSALLLSHWSGDREVTIGEVYGALRDIYLVEIFPAPGTAELVEQFLNRVATPKDQK